MTHHRKLQQYLVVVALGLFALGNAVLWQVDLQVDNEGEKYQENMELFTLKGSPKVSLAQNYSDILDLTDNPKLSQNPTIATDSKKNVHVVWHDYVGGDGTTSYILYRKFNWETQTWSGIENISLSNVKCMNPDIAIDAQDNVHVVWQGKNWSWLTYNIYYRNYSAASNMWADGDLIRNVTQISGTELFVSFPKIAVVERTGKIQVVWEQYVSSLREIAGSSSSDGFNWETTGTIYRHGSQQVEVYNDYAGMDLAADKDNLHLTWAIALGGSGSELYYMNDSDGSLVDDKVDDAVLLDSISKTSVVSRCAPSLYINNRSAGFAEVYLTWAWYDAGDGFYDILSTNKTATSYFRQPYMNVTLQTSAYFDRPKMGVDSSGLAFFLFYQDATTDLLYLTNSSRQGDLANNLVCQPRSSNQQLDNPTLAIDVNNSLHMAWEDSYDVGDYSGIDNYDIFYRQYDRYAPQVKIASPANNTLHTNLLFFNGTCQADTRFVNLSIQDVGRGETSWHNINSTEMDATHFKNGWNRTWQPAISYKNITVRVNATDVNGLTDEYFIGNLSVDIDSPTITLTNIIDTIGNNYAVNGNRSFTDTVTIYFTTSDTTSGVKNVSLWNGNTRFISVGWNITNTYLQFTVASGDNANYTQLKLRAYDYAGFDANSSIFAEIRFDFYDPEPMFVDTRIGHTNQALVNGTKIRGQYLLVVNATAGNTTVDWVHAKFANSSDGITWYTLYDNWSSLVRTEGLASVLIDTSWMKEVNEYWFNATVFDLAGQNKTIVIWVKIDNNRPDLILDVDGNFGDNDNYQEIGFAVYARVLCDNDTISVAFHNRTNIAEPWDTILVNNTWEESIEYPGKRIFSISAGWSTTEYHYAHSYQLYLLAVCTDDAVSTYDSPGWMNETEIELTLSPVVPDMCTNLAISLVNGTEVLIEWEKTMEISVPLIGFRIYRLYFDLVVAPYDLATLNDLNPFDVTLYYGFFAREAILVADESILKWQDGVTQYNFTDKGSSGNGLDPNNYFYVVIAVNQYLNPSDIYDTLGIEIPKQEPTRSPDYVFDNILWAIVYTLITLWVIIPIVGVVQGRRAGKRDLIDFTMDANVVKGFNAPKSFEKDVSDLDLKMRKELGMELTSPAETEFLAQEVVKNVTPGVEVKETTLKNCPKCGWVLSAGATKCIRCGNIITNLPKGGDIL